MAEAEQIRAVVEQYVAHFSAGDRAGWLALWAEDATMEDPVGTPLKTGHDEIGAFFEQSMTMADSLRLVLTGPVCIAAGEVAFGMQARPTMGGTEFCVDIVDVMQFSDGPDGTPRIQTMRAFWDPATMRPAD
jgi:steroid delta-isomerase